MDHLRKTLLPILAAFIWGTAFVAQSVGADYMPPFAFNTVRSCIATLALLAVVWLFAKLRKEPFLPPKEQRRDLLIGGICCGGMLAIASALQQALEGIGLRHCARESVEDYSVFGLGFVVEDLFQNLDHQRVGDELALLDVGVGNLPDGRFAGYMVAEHFTCGDVVKAVFVNELFALGAFA